MQGIACGRLEHAYPRRTGEGVDGNAGHAPHGACRARRGAGLSRADVPQEFEALMALADDDRRDRIPVADLLDAMRERAIVALVLLFALPNLVPAPPGTSAVLGAPLLLLAIEWMLGLRPWVPRFVARRTVSRRALAAMLRGARDPFGRARRLSRPRLPALCTRAVERPVSALCVLLSLVILLPIPFGNMPPAWALCIIALGWLRRDGLWVGIGAAVGVAALALAAQVGLALVGVAADWLRHAVAA